MTNSQKPDGYPDNNPKTAVGVSKVPMHFIPPVALVHLGLAMEDGGGKYGLMNWREFTVSSSVYYDAILRHLLSWWDGEDAASDSGVHHLGHVMACCAILLDAEDRVRLNDDRPAFEGGMSDLLARIANARKDRVKVAEMRADIEAANKHGLRELAAREAGMRQGELDLFGQKAEKPPEDADNDDLKHFSRTNLPKPGTALMRRGLRIKAGALWFEDTIIVQDIDKVLIPSDAARFVELVDAIDGEPHPTRWADANQPEG